MEHYRQIMDLVGTAIDGIGVFVIIGGALVATARLVLHRRQRTGNYYSLYRQDVGRAIFLGLIVLIRTVLSLSLQLEIEGKLPWRREAPH